MERVWIAFCSCFFLKKVHTYTTLSAEKVNQDRCRPICGRFFVCMEKALEQKLIDRFEKADVFNADPALATYTAILDLDEKIDGLGAKLSEPIEVEVTLNVI